jgi:hypothetical protein
MHPRHYQNRTINWCRYSEHAHEQGIGRQKPWRIGKLLRYGEPRWPDNRPPYAIVLWNGNRTTTQYYRGFIEVFATSEAEVPDIPNLPVFPHLLRSFAWRAS